MKRLYFTLCFLLALAGQALLQAQTTCLVLKSEHLAATTGTEVCLDVRVENFQAIIGMQYSLRWDPSVLSFQEVNNLTSLPLSSTNFGLPGANGTSDHLTFAWTANDSQSRTLPDEALLFSVCFEIIGNSGDFSPFAFDVAPTPFEFLSGDGPYFSAEPASMYGGSVTVAGSVPDLPMITSASCPQANSCSEVPPVGIETITTGGTPAYAYQWTGPGGYTSEFNQLTDILPGNYLVTVTDAAGRQHLAAFHSPDVDPLSIQEVDIVPPTSCDENAANGGISFAVQGGSGAYTYAWSDGSTDESRTGLAAGLYEVTVSDMLLGCSTTQSFTLTTGSSVFIRLATITDVSCGTTNTGAVRLELAGNTAGSSIMWSNGAAGQQLESLAPGTYKATITDSKGCSFEWAGQVRQSSELEILGNIGYENCEEASGYIDLFVPGEPADFTYAWSTGATTQDISGLSFGSYRVTVTNPGTGCTGYQNFHIKDEEFLTGYNYECVVNGQSILSKVSTIVWSGGDSPYTFTWSNGDVITDYQLGWTTVTLPATLMVTITDSKGCSTVVGPIVPDCDGGNGPDFSTASNYVCLEGENGEPAQARITYTVWEGGLPPYTFSWSTGETFSGITQSSIIGTADAMTPYYVTVTDQSGQVHVSNPITPICNIDGAPLTLDVGEAGAAPGDQVCVPVSVAGFNNIAALQFSLSWDPTQLVADAITNINLPDFDVHDYNLGPFTTGQQGGVLTVAWVNTLAQGYNVPDAGSIFEVCFTIIGDAEVAEVVVSNHPTLIEATTGNSQIIPVITEAGAVYIDDNSISKVWPGDTDNNGLVDHFDLLNIGLAFGTTGYPRPAPSLNWEGQFAAPWGQNTPNSEVDYRHIDTDGNGTIDAVDTLALALNYRLFNEQWDGEDGYNKRENLPPAARTSGAPLYVDTYPVEEGTMPVFDIVLGDDANPIDKVYGLGFSINYDPLALVPGSLQLSFANSWLGEIGNDLLSFYRVDSQNHKIHVAITRIDGLEVGGKGPIAQLLVTIEDVIFRSNEYEIPISIENARLITRMEELVSVIERSSVITVSSTTHTLDPALDRQIQVYPVPANENLFIKTPPIRIEAVMLYDLEGRIIRQWTGLPDQLSLNGLPQGTFTLRFITEKGVAVRRVVVLQR